MDEKKVLLTTEIHRQDSQTALLKTSKAAQPGILLLPQFWIQVITILINMMRFLD